MSEEEDKEWALQEAVLRGVAAGKFPDHTISVPGLYVLWLLNNFPIDMPTAETLSNNLVDTLFNHGFIYMHETQIEVAED